MLTLRDATPGDAMAVARLNVRSWQEGYRGLLDDEYLDGLRAEDRARRYTFGSADPNHPVTTVAVDDGAICGFVATQPGRGDEADTTGVLCALYVEPSVWGRGVGRALIAHARSHLRRRGCTDAVLWMLVGNDRAERFYRADGWLPDGEQRAEYVWGIRVEEICFRRRLP